MKNAGIVMVMLGLLPVFGPRAAVAASCEVVPGWAEEGAARIFEADNLFEYLNGNAEGYLIYGFIRLENKTCRSGNNSISVDVFEMVDSDAAYGIFSAQMDPAQPTIKLGMGGQLQSQRAIFCKGNFYVEVTAHTPTVASASLQALAQEIEKSIPGRTAPPEGLSWFPPEQLRSVRLIPQSVLGLRVLRRGYTAEYEFGKAFVVPEESVKSAAAVMEKLRARFAQQVALQLGDDAFRATDRYLGHLCVFRKGRVVAGFVNLPEDHDPLKPATALAARLP